MNRKMTCLWFLLGLGLKLQVVASLSITEMIVLLSAPYLFLKDYHQLRKDGIWVFFVLSLMVIVGCVISSIANHTPPKYVLRGVAVTCIVSCSIIFSHWILRRDPGGFKWFILAIPLSAIISTFYFKASVETAMLGESSEEIMSGPIFWISRLNHFVLAPTKGWYLQIPFCVNVLAPLFMAGFAMLTSISGRSSALTAIAFSIIVVIGGKTRRSMSRISRHFGLMVVLGFVLIGAAYMGYKVSAMAGWLGEDARRKYEVQSDGGEGGILRLILGGRGGSFIGLLACRDKPILGWGPWAKDANGYTEEFVTRFGTMEDVIDLNKAMLSQWYNADVYGIGGRMLPCHAYITEFWAWYGVWGLVFWLYIIYVLLRHLKQDIAAVPQWFAWLACSIPGMFWGMFFSPFSDRVSIPLSVVACLMARAVRKGQFMLPREMMVEIEKVERK